MTKIDTLRKINKNIVHDDGTIDSFERQLIDFMFGEYDYNYPFVISTNSEGLKLVMDIDLDKPLCIDVKTVIKCERKHSLDLSFVSHIDDYIRESCLAFESLTQETSIVFVLNRKSDTFELPYIAICRTDKKCGEHGLTIGELIENFVGDLVGGTYSNGSDERDYADQWFERCWFGMFPEPTLLNHLLNLGYEPEHYLDMLENVETIKSDIEITKQNIAEPSDEWKDIVYHKYNDDFTSYECVPCYNSVDEYIASEKEDLESYKADLEEALEELKDMRADWKPEKEPNMNEEIELIKKWVKEREDFINE